MKNIKIFAVLFGLAGSMASGSPIQQTTVYDLHLSFGESKFVDVMTINQHEDGTVSGDMHVPNDFDGPLLDLNVGQTQVSFDLFVPKNSYRPEDLVFHYEGQFLNIGQRAIRGVVTIKGEAEPIATFIAYERKPNED